LKEKLVTFDISSLLLHISMEVIKLKTNYIKDSKKIHSFIERYWNNDLDNMDINVKTLSLFKYMKKLKVITEDKIVIELDNIQNFKDNGNVANGLVHKILTNL
jgi:hypothetical protein